MADYQIVGDSQPMQKAKTDPPTHGGPNPNAQIVGDSVPLGRNQVSPPTNGGPPPNAQIVGDGVNLTRTQSPVWAQSNIPRSTLANEPGGNDKS